MGSGGSGYSHINGGEITAQGGRQHTVPRKVTFRRAEKRKKSRIRWHALKRRDYGKNRAAG